MNQTLLSEFGTPEQRVERAIAALREGRGVMVLDDENRENEGDMIFAAETMTVEQMALTIRHGSGIVCLCLTEARRQQLALPMMVENNTSSFGTGFTVTIEAAEGVTTGVSAGIVSPPSAPPLPTMPDPPICIATVTSSRCVPAKAAY